MSLLEWRRPSDVAGFVISGRVNSVDGHSSGAISDACEDFLLKDFKIIIPWFVERDTCTAPIFVTMAIGVIASFFYRLPSVVKEGARSLWRESVPQSADIPKLRARPATSGVSAAKPSDAGGKFLSAIASNAPMRATVLHVGKAKCGQISETLTCYIQTTHGGLLQRLACQGRSSVSPLGRPAYLTTGAT